MAAGHVVAGQCVDVAASAGVFFGQALPAHVPGAVTYHSLFSFDSLAASWRLLTFSDGVLSGSDLVVAPLFAACDTTELFFDGMQIGWLVVASMVAAWAVHHLRRAL